MKSHSIIIAVVIVLVLVGLCVHTAAALDGSGTQEDPYLIQSLADFDEFASDPNYWSGFTRLETDVNLSGRTYSTAVIAPDTSNTPGFYGTAFTGVFDGNAHKVIGLTINGGTGNDFLGLFGHIDGGEVTNLGLEGGSVSGDSLVGGLVGENYFGSISNCYSTGSVSGSNYDVGGLVGENYGSLSNCYSIGNVNGYYDVAGLCGYNSGTIFHCNATGNVTGGNHVGGLVGENSLNGIISNSYSIGEVNGNKYFDSVEFVGGLVGLNEGANVSNCYSTGDVSGDWDVGGLVGGVHFGSVSNCYSTGSVSGDYCVGGLAGIHVGGSISNCYSTGDVNGYGYVGGLIGSGGNVRNCYSTANVNGVENVGGLMGENGGSVLNCYSTGDVNGVGGVGGLVGQNGYVEERHPVPGYIIDSYSTGDVNGGNGVGGLLGSNFYGSVSNCYSTGSVIGNSVVGGLVGQNGSFYCIFEGCSGLPGYIYNSYSTGDVNGIDDLGGLVGYNAYGDIEKSFWDVETSGEPNMCGYQNEEYATGCDPNCGKTTAEMKTISTFTDAGWDFIETWGIGEHQTYPYLRFAPAGDLNYDSKVDLFDLAIISEHWLEEN